MANPIRDTFLSTLTRQIGKVRKLPRTQSLYDIGNGARIYIRYSKRHRGQTAFYGLRQKDLAELEGRPAYLCFLWEGQIEPLIVPFSDYEEIFESASPASDGQYKVHIHFRENTTELSFGKTGRFNITSGLGEICSFLEYADVYKWHERLRRPAQPIL